MPTAKKKTATKSSGSSSNGSKAKTSSASAGTSANQSAQSGQTGEQFDKLFTDMLKDIYWAEKHLTKALPKMQKAATSEELQEAIENHLEQTKEHISRLEQVFETLGKKAQAKKCDAMEGLVKEGESVIEENEEGKVRDAGIIVSAQKVEHYEIASYGSLVQLARTMGNEEVAEILAQTLEEEKETDELLTQIAENNVNQEAAEEDESEEEEEEDDEEEEEEEEEK